MSEDAGDLDVATRFRTALEHAAQTGDWALVYPCLAPDVEWITAQRTLHGIDQVERDLRIEIVVRDDRISRYEIRRVG